MSRITSNDNPATQRTKLAKIVVLAIRELMTQETPDEQSKDLVATIIMALSKIHDLVDRTALAWEKRDYWNKADRFRLDWEWAVIQRDVLLDNLQGANWQNIAKSCLFIGEKLKTIQISSRSKKPIEYKGAWKELQAHLEKKTGHSI